MAIERRGFLTATTAGLGALALSRFVAAGIAGRPRLAGCFRDTEGDHLAMLSDDGIAVARVRLPGRGHGMAQRPLTGEVVVFARRPGTFALALDPESSEIVARIDSIAGHHFQGHGAFSADGRYLFTAENHYAKEGRGVVGNHDAADGYKRVGRFDAHGVGICDLALMPDGKTLALANGGILTHPGSGRAKLNLATMIPSLAYVETASGRLLADYRLAPESHQASIRHMAVNAEGTVVVFQYAGAKTWLVPLVGIHAGEDAIQLPAAPEAVTAHMRHYCGSVASEPAGRRFAVTSPRGNLATFWDAAERKFLAAAEIADVCGAAAAGRDGRFYLASGAGGMVDALAAEGRARPLAAAWLGCVKWDNHLLALAPLPA
ncbi:MAG: DUF1513 domain-containing protein [Rhodospirillaceae bacterium]